MRAVAASLPTPLDGEVITTTDEHPFWVVDHGWVEAQDLQVGMQLQTRDGDIVDIDRTEQREGDFTVYNFKVDDFHTYFVSDLGILVHNANCGGNFTPSPALEGNPYHPDVVEQRIRPPYRSNPAHDPRSPLFNPRKTPEPTDTAQVYESAIRADMGTWYGTNQRGDIYRFFGDNAGGVHFSGIVSSQLVPNDVLRQIRIQGKNQ